MTKNAEVEHGSSAGASAKESIYRRELEDRMGRFLQRKEIIGIRGARQTGKTTLMRMIAESLPPEEKRAFVNMDIAEYRRALEENPRDFVKRQMEERKKLFLFLDEIQKVKNGGENLKIIYDEFPRVKAFISGSSSLEMKTNVLPSLVGRLLLFELYTFGFGEFLSARDAGLHRLFREKNASLLGLLEGKDDPAPPSFAGEFLDYWKDYAVFGGYPEVVKSRSSEEKITILKNIFNLYLEKDIMAFFKVEETSKFEDLLKALAFNISGILSVSSMASDLKISYKRTEEFISMLQHTYIISLLRPFHRNVTTEIKKSPKIYFLDLGLRNSAINNFSAFDNRSDRGSLMENFVLRELVSGFGGWKINYWRTAGKAEMDFVLTRDEKMIPVEVKLAGDKLGRSFHSFLNAYKPEKAVVATLDTFRKQKVGKTTVYWVPVFYF
jgi:hypothetical protein